MPAKDQTTRGISSDELSEREKGRLEIYINTICFSGYGECDLILTQEKSIAFFEQAHNELETLRLKLLTQLKNL